MFFGIELNLFVVCIIVVLGRIVDMALATIRTVFTVKNKPHIAAPIGFIEAFFWFLIVKAALDYAITNPVVDTLLLAVAYSLGFALGTFIGGLLSKLFVKTNIQVQVVLSKKDDALINKLKEEGYGQTVISCFGANNKTERYMVFVETESSKLKELKQIIDSFDEKAFISVNESKNVFRGYGVNRK